MITVSAPSNPSPIQVSAPAYLGAVTVIDSNLPKQVFVQETQPEKIFGIPWVWLRTEADAIVEIRGYNGMVV